MKLGRPRSLPASKERYIVRLIRLRRMLTNRALSERLGVSRGLLRAIADRSFLTLRLKR